MPTIAEQMLSILVGLFFVLLLVNMTDLVNTVSYIRRLEKAQKDGSLRRYYDYKLREPAVMREKNPIPRFLIKKLGYVKGAAVHFSTAVLLLYFLWNNMLFSASTATISELVTVTMLCIALVAFYAGLVAHMVLENVWFHKELARVMKDEARAGRTAGTPCES